MNDTFNDVGLHAVYERLTRLEERGASRDERMARMESALERLTTQVETIALDVRDAKTGLRVGLWISNTVWPIMAAGGGWIAHHFWPGK